MGCDKQMRYIVQNTENYNTHYCDFSSFNRIKRSSLVRSDDAVESVKSHIYNEESTAETGHPGNGYCRGITQIHRSPSRPRPSVRLTAALINIHEHLI